MNFHLITRGVNAFNCNFVYLPIAR
uniref:Uncharacterized protein n=1 Tax=Rhizophora mucronata TaxID=61149 RepID=A0A2P2NSX5_RHIMU